MPPTLAAFLFGLCILSLAICSPSVIETGRIPSVSGKMPVFRNFWIYGNVSRLATQITHNIKFRESSNGCVVRFSWNAFTVDSLTFSVKSDNNRKLNFGNVPENASFLAFDSRNTIYENVESACTAGQDLMYICLVVSDYMEWRQWLRSQALNLVANIITATQVPLGTFMACVHVTSRGVSNPKAQPLTDMTSIVGFRSNYWWSTPSAFTFQEGIIKSDVKAGMFFKRILVHGNLTEAVSFGQSVVRINDGYNAVTITGTSAAVDNPIFFVGLDGESGHILVLKDFQTRPDFSVFIAVDKSRAVHDIRGGMTLAKRSYVCLAFSLLPETINILRRNIFSLIRGTFRLPEIPVGSLVVCVQVASLRTSKLHVPNYPTAQIDDITSMPMPPYIEKGHDAAQPTLNRVNQLVCNYSDLESCGHYYAQPSHPEFNDGSMYTENEAPFNFPDVSLEGTGFKIPDSAIEIGWPLNGPDTDQNDELGQMDTRAFYYTFN